MREESIDQVGLSICEQPNRISDTISRSRVNERIRVKLSAHLNIPYEKLWGEEPKAKAKACEATGSVGGVETRGAA